VIPPGVQHTHDLTFGSDRVTKVYTSWERGEPDREWAVLALLAEHAPGLAPEPLDRTEVDGRPGIVMSRLPGEPLGNAALTDRQVAAVGDALVQLHTVPAGYAARLGERVSGPATLAAATVAGWLADDADLAPCLDPGLVAEAVTAARAWLAVPDDALAAQGEPVVAQGDGNPANLMWDGERVRLLDFEDAGLSDRAYEIADLVEHAATRLPRLAAAEVLVRATGLPEASRERLLACRRLFACFWLVMLLPGNRGFHRNPPGSTEDQARHLLRLLPR
jgi:Ser/Thr protein kinase RdoA (MazF antagonist)